jgi:hypothetical protein
MLKHRVIYSVLLLIIGFQALVIWSNDYVNKSQEKSWQYIVEEIVMDRDDWCIRNKV